MKDPIIREYLRKSALAEYLIDPNSKVVEELKLPVAKARIDIAVINGHMHGYEIKSASDTLLRLPAQIEAYEKVFDFLSVVTEYKHADKLASILPHWVNLLICHSDGSLETLKEGRFNHNKNGFYIAKLLWRDEIINILKDYNIPYHSKDRNWILCEHLSENIDTEELSQIVREKLKIRQSWK